jgi:hypothetical protein
LGESGDNWPRELTHKAIGIARNVLEACARTKVLDGNDVAEFRKLRWEIALLARVVSGCEAAALLIDNERYWEAQILARSAFESLVTLVFLHENSSQASGLTTLLTNQSAIDNYEYVEFYRSVRGVPEDDFYQLPQFKEIREEYESVQNGRNVRLTGLAGKHIRPVKSWGRVRLSDLLKCVQSDSQSEAARVLQYVMKRLGDMAAHSSTLALSQVSRGSDSDRTEFRLRPELPGVLGQPHMIWWAPFMCATAGAMHVIDAYFLGEDLQREAKGVFDEYTARKREAERSGDG